MEPLEPKWTREEERQRKVFQRKLDELCTIISEGLAYFSAWKGLIIEDEETVAALNRYPGFFVPTHAALKWLALLQFSKVFDRNPRTVSLRILLRDAKANRAVLTPYASEQDLLGIAALIIA